MKEKLMAAVMISVLFCGVFFLGCEQPTVKETIVTNIYAEGGSDPDDLDGDGLSNAEESSLYGTSPILADTDGDGFSDYTELIEYGFNPAVNPVRFNPLVSDLPKFTVRLTSPPAPYIDLTTSTGASQIFESSRTDQQSQQTSFGASQEISLGLEVWAEVSGTLNFTGPFPSGGEASVTAGAKATMNTTFGFNQQQSYENRTAVSSAEAYEQTNQITESGGGIMVTIEVANEGPVAFGLDNLILSASYNNYYDPTIFMPVGNLVLDTSGNYTSFP